MKPFAACVNGIMLLFLTGCAFVNVSLVPPDEPLGERVIEGRGRPKILLIDISGFISERERSGVLGLKERPSLLVQVREELMKAEQDPDIAGVIVKINTPGGTVTASDIIHHEIAEFRNRTGIPVYACILGVGTSGGYYVAVAADRIFAHPTSVTGNIGIVVLKFNIEGLLDKIGVAEETFKSGDKKDIMSVFRQNTPEEREIVKGVIESMHRRFIDTVHAGRKEVLTREEIGALADGRIYTAGQALEARLIDDVGYLDDAIGAMKESLGIRDARIIAYYRSGDARDTIYSSSGDGRSSLLNLVRDGAGISPFQDVQLLYLWGP